MLVPCQGAQSPPSGYPSRATPEALRTPGRIQNLPRGQAQEGYTGKETGHLEVTLFPQGHLLMGVGARLRPPQGLGVNSDCAQKGPKHGLR